MNNSDYSDIIDAPRPISKKHPPMSMEARAAQFSAFAALTGHKEGIDETAIEVQLKMEADTDRDPYFDI